MPSLTSDNVPPCIQLGTYMSTKLLGLSSTPKLVVFNQNLGGRCSGILFQGGLKKNSEEERKKERKTEILDGATDVNYGVSFLIWSKSICNSKTGIMRDRGPEGFCLPRG